MPRVFNVTASQPNQQVTPEDFPPCPFCGGAARIEIRGRHYLLTGTHDRQCVLAVVGTPLASLEISTNNLSRLITSWSSRAKEIA
jgi:hypothetical protein